jgi:hypothetical protein
MTPETEFVKSHLEELKTKNNIGAGKLRIPSPLDELTSKIVQSFVRAAHHEREAIESLLSDEHAFVLLGFAERMATLSVRRGSEQFLREGLAALVLEGGKFDIREDILAMAPLYDAARRLGLDAEQLFLEIASLSDNRVSRVLRHYPLRPEHAKSLEAMRYEVGSDEDGFLYRRAEW